ncbi:MAG: glyoxalase superfamily protein [Neomegalonema sp.]|nr:glyoxalase superfamily protein [Neomegalonema sp.]
MSNHLPSVSEAKAQAKRLREKMGDEGAPIGHGQSLELIAHQLGFRDWNSMLAAIRNKPPRVWEVGARVTGRYLGHAFSARITSLTRFQPGWFRLQLELDEAVDVVASEHYSNFRKRIRGVVGPKGHSVEHTSDGRPHLQIDL